MSPEELNNVLQSHQLWVTSGGKEGERANLEGAELDVVDLHNAILEQAEFKNTNIRESNFQGAKLCQASFEGAKLWRADFQNADLNGAKFKNAYLPEVNLQDAHLPMASFDGAIMHSANLRDAYCPHAEFGNASLTRANLQGARLAEASFDSAKLQEADLQNALLNDAQFKNADLSGTNLRGSELRRASFDKATLKGANLQDADLQNANLENADFLLTSQLAGADVAGAKLPEAIAEFEGLKTIAEATSNAQKLFVAMFGGCLYSWLTIGTTTDVALLTNSASSPLPVIGTPLPMVGFYLVAPLVLLALYFYFHLNMQRLWEALADLPAVFPDGRSLDKRADPWLLNGLVSAHFARLRTERPALSHLQQWLSILLAWWVVPMTLFVFWGRFLMRHDRWGTGLHVVLLAVAIGFGCMSYRLARATLRGKKREPFRWAEAWKDISTYKRVAAALSTGVLGIVLFYISLGAIEGIPYGESPPYRLRVLVPDWLGAIGFSPFADLYEADVSTKPPNWTGKVGEYPLVKGARLVRAQMQYANAPGAFFVNADLSSADLSNANLWGANLSNARLENANLSNVRLGNANLSNANLQAANFSNSDLHGANLSNANITQADFSNADLEGANLSNLSNAGLSGTNLRGANLLFAQGLTKSQLSVAKTDYKTRLPQDLSP